MATISRQPPPRSASAYTASSKSLASSPSMVTSGRSRRSSRPSRSAACTSGAKRFASAMTAGGNSCGRSCRRIAKRAANSDGRRLSSTSTMRPCAAFSPCGRLVSSTMTGSPSSAPCRSRAVTSMEYQWPGSSGSTWPPAFAPPGSARQMPPMRAGASPMRRIRRATRRPRSFMPTARTSTRSPCISVGVSARASTKGAEPSSGITSTSPLARPRTRPATRSPSPAVAKPFGPSIA